MIDHLPDAPVSTERLEWLAQVIEGHGPLCIEIGSPDSPKQHLEIAAALRELKALREQCERMRKALEYVVPIMKDEEWIDDSLWPGAETRPLSRGGQAYKLIRNALSDSHVSTEQSPLYTTDVASSGLKSTEQKS